MVTVYTKITKPTTSYTPVGVGYRSYDDATVSYDDATVQYGGAVNTYTNVAKPTGTVYTKITKAT